MPLLFLLACTATEREPEPQPEPLDVSERLEAGEVRAGRIESDDALFGGIGAEGRVGDYKIYSDRVQFVIQDLRPSSYYMELGGFLIDADTVRPEGHPGRDRIDDYGFMAGVGRIFEPESIEVVSDGSDGEAVIRVTGDETGLALLEGAVEIPGLVDDLGLSSVTEYRLKPDSWRLEVITTVTASDMVADVSMGDVMFGGPEVSDTWQEGEGLGASGAPHRWTAYVDAYNDGVVAMLPTEGLLHDGGGAALLAEIADLLVSFGDEVIIEPGESVTFRRYLAVAPTLADISDEHLTAEGIAVDTVSGTVTAPDGPVAGARVNILVDDEPFTVAVSGDGGSFSALVPAGSNVSTLADGRGRGLFVDLPEGHGPYGPYAAEGPRAQTLASMVEGVEGHPYAQGRGVGTDDDPLTLGEPATLSVNVADGGPFELRVLRTAPDVVVDERLVPDRPRGDSVAAGWGRDGNLEIPVEPGEYDILIHRGHRFGYHMERVTLAPGQATEVNATLDKAFDHPGWMYGDPHAHAAPSGDGEVTMEGRLAGWAGNGVQLHFGTDHDHAADYTPLLEGLGLDDHMRSVLADEVSPPIRGHMNVYPLTTLDAPNDGAYSWWTTPVADTEEQISKMRARWGDVIIQANHPITGGMAGAGGWVEGFVDTPSYWSTDVQSIEVLNGDDEIARRYWWDMALRGHPTAPVGVTDAHGTFSGDPGVQGTWIHMGSDDPADYSPEKLKTAIRDRLTVAVEGVFLDLSVLPGEVTAGTEVTVTAKRADWVQVDRLVLWRDGDPIETVEGTTATFTLDADVDAVFAIYAEGDQPMSPVSGKRPYALTGHYLVDGDGGGWEAVLPPFELDL